MKRRRFLSVPMVLLAGKAVAQPRAKEARVGLIFVQSRASHAPVLEGLIVGLRELGYVEGRNLRLEYRYTEGRADLLPAAAAELVAMNVDVIVSAGTPAIKAAMAATSTIPIVFAVAGDPVASGHVASLARPGGNVTGFSILAAELSQKRLQLLKEIFPQASRVALLFNPGDQGMAMRVNDVHTAAKALGIAVQSVEVRQSAELETAFAAIAGARADAMLTVLDTLTLANRKQIVDFAVSRKLPAMFEMSEFVESGGLMSYGPSLRENYRRAAGYVDRILKGAKPGELPVQQPTSFHFTLNAATAKAIGLALPPAILLRADRVIE